MAPSMKNMGPACCCCEHFLWGNEIGVGVHLNPESQTMLLEKPDTPTVARSTLEQYVSPSGDSFTVHAICPDWKNKRMYLVYNTWVRSLGSVVDTNSTFKWWDTKQTGDSGTLVVTINSLIADALAPHADDEQIYFTGRSHTADSPYPSLAADYSIDLWVMDYDGTNQTNLATVDVFRSGGFAPSICKIGPMLINRPANRLYYVVRQNYTTASSSDYVWEIRYRDTATFTETSIYSVTAGNVGADTGDTYIRLLNCLSFDLTDEKIYWCESYITAGGRQEGKVRRANLDGSGVELLYQSSDPLTVNFARYSNKLGKIVHGDYNRTAGTDQGVWLRNKAAWGTDPELIALESRQETSLFAASSSFLWCGFEGATA